MQEKILSWQTYEPGASKKSSSWYWTVAIVALGVSAASFIASNILLGVLAIISALAIMLAGSRPEVRQTCAISNTGLHIGSSAIPFTNISRFSIQEDEPRRLTLETGGLTGTISLSLEGVDFRAVRSELKNRNIEEVDSLNSLGGTIAELIGM